MAPCSKDELVRAGTCALNKIGKRRVRPSPGGRVAVSEQILHHKRNQAHSGRSTNRTRGTWQQYQAHMIRMTAPQKENRATVASLPNGRSQQWLVSESQWCTCKHVLRGEVTCEWKSMFTCEHVLRGEVTCDWKSTVHLQARVERWLTWEWKSMVHLQARLERWGDLWVKVNGHLWAVTCEWKSAVLLVDTSRVTQERPRSLCMEHPEAAAEVEVVLERCCLGGLGEVLSRQQ